MFDYHMHSAFSADCETPMEDTIKRAIEIGLKEICFTEHIDYDYPDKTILFEFDVQEYDTHIKRLQEKYKEQITVKKGIEIGLQPHVLEKTKALVDREYFDFIIASMHATNKQDLHSGEYFEAKTPEEAYAMYYEELLYCVQNFKDYSVLGHLDLVKRYKKLDTNNNFHDHIRQIFETIIPDGKGIEVNTSGFGYGLGHALPSEDILRLYHDCGGEIITLGSDSHFTRHLAHRFDEMIALLSSIGFKYVTTFENRQPIMHDITKWK